MTTRPALVFVHSPLVGPSTWGAVADLFEAGGRRTVVPDLTVVWDGDGPYHPAIARRVREDLDHVEGKVVVVGHSGAGPLLPGIAAESPAPVQALVYVDAGLPRPGRSWFDAAVEEAGELADQLTGMVTDGRLPPWHEWFPPESVAGLLPDAALRESFTAEVPRLPVAYFQEPTSPATWSGPAGYLLLSEAYRDDAARAGAQGVTVAEYRGDHLSMVTAPEEVAAKLGDLLELLPYHGRG